MTSENIMHVFSLRGREGETINHLFIIVTSFCIFGITSSGGTVFLGTFPILINELVEAWRMGPFHGHGLYMWRCIPFAILWSIWKERNERIFRAKSTSINALIEVVVLRVVKWLLYGNELVDVKLNNILHNWSACTVCGPTIEGKLEAWSPPPRGIELEVQC